MCMSSDLASEEQVDAACERNFRCAQCRPAGASLSSLADMTVALQQQQSVANALNYTCDGVLLTRYGFMPTIFS
jgi:hypothetical protein